MGQLTMESRERVRRAVTFDHPDRIPLDFWILPGISQKYSTQLEKLLVEYPLDFLQGLTTAVYDQSPWFEAGEWVDPWGVRWRNHQSGIIGQPVECPIADYDALTSYEPPYYLIDGGYPPNIAQTIADQRHLFVVGGFLRTFERVQWLRGAVPTLIDLAEDREEMKALRDLVVEYNLQEIDMWLKYDLDAICFSDDWGSQNNLLISPKIWRAVFKDGYAEMISKVKEAGKLVFFHSDGYIIDIIDDLIEMGVDALNAQVWCMDLEELGNRFNGRICFWGELDRQQIMPYGTPDDIYAAAQKMKVCLSNPAGGLIGQAEPGLEVPLENIEAALNSWN